MDIQEILHIMKHTPWVFYYVDPSPEKVRLGKNFIYDYEYPGEAFSVNESNEYEKRRERIDETGCRICIMPIPSGWEGINQFNYDHVDDMVRKLLEGHENRFFIPRVHMEPPIDWMRKHPEELCVYYGGPDDPAKISAMVGTSQQDIPGMDGAIPPYPDQKIGRQSFSSTVWLKDAGEAWANLICHLDNGSYGRQIIGYMPQTGNCGENVWWGDWRAPGDNRRGDFGIHHRKLFAEWAIQKYGSMASLKAAWNDPDLTFETITDSIPSDRWCTNKNHLYEILLADDQRQVDSNEFHSKCCIDAMTYFGKIVKDLTGKAVGTFYGYLLDDTAGYSGHTAIEEALKTPYLDFFSSPKGYHFCQAGDPGSSQAPGQSFSRKKIWIEENDTRSYHLLETNPKDTYAPKNFDETFTCFWREIYRNLTFQQGFWWMSSGLYDDWYNDDKMVEMLKQQSFFYQKWSPVSRQSTAEILFVEDEQSCNHMTQLSGMQWSLKLRLERELRLCGAPVDHFRVDDLMDMDLSRYKFIVFCHAFVMPESKWHTIENRIRPDAHVLWNYAAGILDPAYNPENQKRVTGFSVIESPERMQPAELYRHMYWHMDRSIPNDYPLLEIVPEEKQEVLQKSPDGKILTARIQRQKGASIFAVERTLRVLILRKMLENAHVTFYAPENCSVLADDKLTGFFPLYDVSFTYCFDGKWRNVLTGETASGDTNLKIKGKKLAIFEKLD